MGNRRGIHTKDNPHTGGKLFGLTMKIYGVPLGDIIFISGGLLLLYFYVKWQLSTRRPWKTWKGPTESNQRTFDVHNDDDRAKVRKALQESAGPYASITVKEKMELLNLLDMAEANIERKKKDADAQSAASGADEGDLMLDTRQWDAEFNSRWKRLQKHWMDTELAANSGGRLEETVGDMEKALHRFGLRLKVPVRKQVKDVGQNHDAVCVCGTKTARSCCHRPVCICTRVRTLYICSCPCTHAPIRRAWKDIRVQHTRARAHTRHTISLARSRARALSLSSPLRPPLRLSPETPSSSGVETSSRSGHISQARAFAGLPCELATTSRLGLHMEAAT